MSEQRRKFLRKQIKRLTRQIGEADRAHDNKEVSNLRKRRGEFALTLAEEFDEFHVIRDGKSYFVEQEEAQEHYSSPDVRKNIAAANAVTDMSQSRDYLKSRYKILSNMTPEEVKEKMLEEINDQLDRVEKAINSLRAHVNKEPLDFNKIDEAKDDDFLDGIDLESI